MSGWELEQPQPPRDPPFRRTAFRERGYRAVTVRDIAADAGVSAALAMKLFLSTDRKPAMGSCCSTNNSTIEDLTLTAGPIEANDAVTTCPVMACSTVAKSVAEGAGLFRDYEGKRYWFCCVGCGPAFDAEPAKYANAS